MYWPQETGAVYLDNKTFNSIYNDYYSLQNDECVWRLDLLGVTMYVFDGSVERVLPGNRSYVHIGWRQEDIIYIVDKLNDHDITRNTVKRLDVCEPHLGQCGIVGSK